MFSPFVFVVWNSKPDYSAPPSLHLASADGMVTPQFVDWFRMFARGYIHSLRRQSIDITECKDEECQLDLSQDRCTAALLVCRNGQRETAMLHLEVNHNGKDST